jgi:hypothetical protein
MRNINFGRASLALAVPAIGAALLVANPAAGAAAQQSSVASATAHNFRVVVSAVRTGSGSAPSATVYVTAYDKVGGVWRKMDQMPLGSRNGFFWDTLTGGHAVRDLTISNSDPRGGSVQLLVSPALGFSPTFHFHLAGGNLVR